ncbi:RagB/SusD family nutrient uptake outer membrane protein [Tunicatimonas pelagia]|uniref:RagB/SusD family nutrient uptake outer membrane protein n=1 Tax=Tunicatimonas pelagia TaxID=931531 RepID=UPI002664FD2A|nr:RagB/SusD family nutrient uptake outer membrane protein [Tunicatimonas pelagia]WKN45429.1 RagB/SusD family nutrient uptake outer membrane protein [Tunicatimonas pelagia]
MMKRYIVIITATWLFFTSCETLDLEPQTAVSTTNFFNNADELQIALNGLYQQRLWKLDESYWDDDGHHRGGQRNNAISRATLNPTSGVIEPAWDLSYEAIKRANVLLAQLLQARERVESAIVDQVEAEARAIRAYFYSKLTFRFGAVPLITEPLTIQESLEVVRTSQEEVKQFVYDELDAAAAVLPDGNDNRATQGFALGIKARFALYMGDYAIARDAAKAVIDADTYSLDPDFQGMFLKSGASSPEHIYFIPYSFELGITWSFEGGARGIITRNAGGFGANMPTWEAISIFDCTDGLTIDESPLYDPFDPFSNRDPRLAQTIVEFGSEWLGYIYQPHPDSLTTLNTTSNTIVNNNDTRSVAIFASFTGLVWKKGVEQSWSDNRTADRNVIILRYGDILLMYAEALIELGENLEEAQGLLNQLRARAYGTTADNLAGYPAITETDQAGLRARLRRERRVELMFEGSLRFQDLRRWRLAEQALDQLVVGLPEPQDQDRSQWPFNNQILPEIDENGLVDLKAQQLIDNGYARLLEDYDFEERMYLWPIPADDILLNDNLTQNPGY